MQRKLFSVIFEGRTGSSELMARLNSHLSIQAFPEILAPICPPDRSWASRRDAIEEILVRLKLGNDPQTYVEAYSKLGADANSLPVRGFKTRLNSRSDLMWYEQVGRTENFYQVEPALLLPILEEHQFHLIRLGRRDLVRNAISWLRGVRLANDHGNRWNVEKGHAGLGPSPIDPKLLVNTIAWLGTARSVHDAAFDAYGGPKLNILYEDLFGQDAGHFQNLLEFLGVPPCPLEPFYVRATEQDLSNSISNYDEVAQYMRKLGMGHLFDNDRQSEDVT
jgi:hypothetical protein